MAKRKPSARRREIERAFQVLYGLTFAEIRDLEDIRRAFLLFPPPPEQEREAGTEEDPAESAAPAEPVRPEASGLAWDLVNGVWLEHDGLDALIDRLSHNWRTDRLGRVELNVLRLGLHAIIRRREAAGTVIPEMSYIMRHFGEESAAPFVAGVLDSAARAVESGEIDPNAPLRP